MITYQNFTLLVVCSIYWWY